MSRLYIFILFLFCFIYQRADGQFSDTLTKPVRKTGIDRAYIKSYFTDAGSILVSPVRWEKKEWSIVAVATGAGMLSLAYDREIRDFFQQNRSPVTDKVSRYFFNPLGSGLYLAPILGTLYGVGYFTQDETAMQAALRCVEAYIISAGFVQVTKHLMHRARPYQLSPADPYQWEGPFGDFSYTSFPSGHTITVFSVATVLSSYYRGTTWVPIVSYSLAALTGLSRISTDKHWASDVLTGAVLGYGIGKLIVNKHHGRDRFLLGAGCNQISLAYRF